jgi:alpha-D-xyloside xylohydrolase
MQATRTIHVRWVDGPREDAGALEPKTDATVQYDGKALTVPKAYASGSAK